MATIDIKQIFSGIPDGIPINGGQILGRRLPNFVPPTIGADNIPLPLELHITLKESIDSSALNSFIRSNNFGIGSKLWVTNVNPNMSYMVTDINVVKIDNPESCYTGSIAMASNYTTILFSTNAPKDYPVGNAWVNLGRMEVPFQY